MNDKTNPLDDTSPAHAITQQLVQRERQLVREQRAHEDPTLDAPIVDTLAAAEKKRLQKSKRRKTR